MLMRALESSRRPAVPPEEFLLPPDGPFALLFVRSRTISSSTDAQNTPQAEPSKPTATDVHTTGQDGASSNPIQNEDLDWENDD